MEVLIKSFGNSYSGPQRQEWMQAKEINKGETGGSGGDNGRGRGQRVWGLGW